MEEDDESESRPGWAPFVQIGSVFPLQPVLFEFLTQRAYSLTPTSTSTGTHFHNTTDCRLPLEPWWTQLRCRPCGPWDIGFGLVVAAIFSDCRPRAMRSRGGGGCLCTTSIPFSRPPFQNLGSVGCRRVTHSAPQLLHLDLGLREGGCVGLWLPSATTRIKELTTQNGKKKLKMENPLPSAPPTRFRPPSHLNPATSTAPYSTRHVRDAFLCLT